jgi:predicted small integral membrane protein
MSIRILKIALVVCVGAQALLYGISNLLNLEGAFGAMAYVFSMADQEYYANPVIPPITWGPLVGLVLAVVIATEALIGLLCFKGALDMWQARRAESTQFASARHYAVLGCGLAMVLWIGLFMAGGGALLQMWQTQVGLGSLEGAFMYAVSSAAVLLFVNQPEEPARTAPL